MTSSHISPANPTPELTTLVINNQLGELLQLPARATLEQESLPAYLPKRRWFSGGAGDVKQVKLLYATPFGSADEPYVLSEVEVVRHSGSSEHYQVPLGYVGEREAGSGLPQQLALARLRRGVQVGLLTDGFTLPGFVRHVMGQLSERSVLGWQGSEIQFVPTARLQELGDLTSAEIKLISAEQSNSSAIINEQAVLKLVRRVLPGIHPEAEIGGYLTAAGFEHIAPLLGEVRRVDEGGVPHTLMILQGYLNNQGDAWQWTLNKLERAVREELAGGHAEQGNSHSALAELETFAGLLGKRLGEMHVALGQASDNPDFGYRETGDAEVAEWSQNITAQVREALKVIADGRGHLPGEAANQADWLAARHEQILERVDDLAQRSAGGIRMRVHGDLHLGQVLVVQGDAYLIDFEGEPTRTLEERRAFYSPLKDVAGMLRSFDYAAAMATRSAQSAEATPEGEQARLHIAELYRSQARTAFNEAYRLAAADLPHAWHDREGEVAALALFCIEKAAYEILYEARYRPDWLEVPVQGLIELSKYLLGSGKR
ncbi:putative maltokinase [Phytopseudomonas punonensis]|uniref:Maltokinase n=1 Tax=Phytopseudomonas punonensis TaxID=1220495 RepID=A0A1M7DSD0_9GAMM|nr:putative maltokinase [Pseudomonas punonensis]SHL82089.1 maltose alpha-D-glucosyltransferase/ alpha-amylase [Pseudomonas punonensis]